MYNCRRVQTPLRMGRRSNEKNARYGRRRSLSVSLSPRVISFHLHFIDIVVGFN